jgi:hypothetical protein
MDSEEALENCDFSGATLLGSSSPTQYTIPPSSSPLHFACSVGSHCASGQKITVNVTDVNLTLAESYYQQALSLWPENCGAMGYLSELYMTSGMHEKALPVIDELCSECGASHEAASYAKELVEAAAGIVLPESCIAAVSSLSGR